MTISVALCTYNGAFFLDAQLNSIAMQTRLPAELIVCDDGSTDTTLDVLRAFSERAPFPVIIHTNPTTLGAAKNFERAISLCSGEFIALCDQDDVWRTDKLERLSAVLEAAPNVGAVFSDAELVDAVGQKVGKRLWQSVRFTAREQTLLNGSKALRVLFKHRVVTGATLMFRASFRARVLPISGLWLHDGWIAFIIALFADLRAVSEPLIAYRQHGANQVGATTSYGEAVQEAVSRRRESYARNLAQYSALRQRIELWADVPNKSSAIAELDAKIAHIQARAHLPESRLWRLLPVAREFVRGRYHRYSSGLQSAAKDIVL